MLKAGIDVGFGSTKAIGSNGRIYNFKSIVGEFSPVPFSFGNEPSITDRLAVEYHERRWYVGEAAIKQSKARQTVDKTRTVETEGILLLAVGLSLLAEDDSNAKIVIGLPVLHYEALRDKYSALAQTLHKVSFLSADGSQEFRRSTQVHDVRVIPQPAGTLFDAILDAKGEICSNLAKSKIGIVDIGYNTLDLAVFDSLEYIGQKSTSFSNSGMFSVYSALAQEIFRGFGLEVPTEQIDSIAQTKKIMIAGKNHDIARQFQAASVAAAEQIIARIRNTWPDIWAMEKIILTGGGSIVLQQALLPLFERDQAVIAQDPVLSNANGYLKYAHGVWKGE